MPNAGVSCFFLKAPHYQATNLALTVRRDEGRMPERQGHEARLKSVRFTAASVLLGFSSWGLGTGGERHLVPGGHGPLSPSPVVTLAELVIFSQPQAILVSALFLPAHKTLLHGHCSAIIALVESFGRWEEAESVWASPWPSKSPSLLLSVSGSEVLGMEGKMRRCIT